MRQQDSQPLYGEEHLSPPVVSSNIARFGSLDKNQLLEDKVNSIELEMKSSTSRLAQMIKGLQESIEKNQANNHVVLHEEIHPRVTTRTKSRNNLRGEFPKSSQTSTTLQNGNKSI